MIIKGRARGRARQLAAHLLRADQNERIRLYECRGTLARDVKGALAEMEAHAAAVNTKRPLYHASISPEAHRPLDDNQIRIAADLLERKLCLDGQPRIIVVHRKEQRNHLHIVWSRVDLGWRRLVSDSWSYLRHEETARELEARFGHRAIKGAFYRPDGQPRPKRTLKEYEHRQAERSGVSVASVTADLTAMWRASANGGDFQARLEAAGYILARGDRRAFVVIDREGGVHSLARRCGLRVADLRERLSGVDVGGIPSVAGAREQQQERSNADFRHRFATASNEVVHLAPGLRGHGMKPARLPRAVLMAPSAFTEAVAVKPHRHTALRPARIIRQPEGGAAANRYRAVRATVIADYASKIAAARQHASPDELDAILAALDAERQAALKALAQREQGRSRSRRAVWPKGHRHPPLNRPRPVRFGRRKRRKLPKQP